MDHRNHPKPELVDPYDLPAEVAPAPRRDETTERQLPERQPPRRRDGRAADATR